MPSRFCSRFRRMSSKSWRGRDVKRIAGHERIRSFHLEALCGDLRATKGEFPSEAHWQSHRFAHGVRAIHLVTPVDFAEFVDYCGTAYYALLGRAAEPGAYPTRIAIRLHNTIEIIERRVGNDFGPVRTHDYALERAAIALADVVLTPGPRYWREEAAELYPLAEGRVQSSFPVRAPLPFVADAGAGRDVVFVGRISTFKGVDRVLHAAVAAFRDPELSRLIRRFVLIGPDETVSSSLSERALLAIAEEVPHDRLVLAGALDEAGLLRHFAEAAVAVFANRVESFCYAAHEAHLAGVPLILSDTPAFRDHFVDGESALFFNNSVPDLLAKLRRCMGDAALRRLLSESGRGDRERYRKHRYGEHLACAAFAPEPAGPEADATIVVVPSAGDAAQARGSARLLAAALPGATLRYLVPADGASGVRAFGRLWSVRAVDGGVVSPEAERLRPAVVFVAAADRLEPSFVARAVAALRAEPRIGAVLPALLAPDGHRAVSELPTTLDRAARDEVRVMSAVMAVEADASLVDLCTDGSVLTEISALLSLRARRRVIADDPEPSLVRRGLPLDGGRAALPAFLRRHAWRLDPVFGANETASALAISGALSVDCLGDGQAELAAHVAASERRRDEFYLHASPGGTPDGCVTILSVRRARSGPAALWEEIEWLGPWETLAAWDRPRGMRASRGGAMRLTGAAAPEVTMLRGPNQGEAALVWHGRVMRVRLADTAYRAVTVRPAALLSLWADGNPAPAIVLGAGVLPDDPAVELLVRAMGESGGATIFLADPCEVPLAEACADRVRAVAVPKDLRDDDERMAASFELAARLAGAPLVSLFGGAEMLGPVDAVLRAGRDVSVRLFLRPGIAWRGGGWEAIRRVAAAARRFGRRLALHAPPGAVREALLALGVSARPWAVRVPAPRIVPSGGPISVVFGPAPAEIPASGHLAAAAAASVRRGLELDAVHVADCEVQAARLLEGYGLGPLVRRYDSPLDVIGSLAGRRFIYLSPYADGAVPGAVLSAFAHGGLALVSPGPLEFRTPELRGALSVVLWEDAHALAGQILHMASRYDDLVRRCVASREATTADA